MTDSKLTANYIQRALQSSALLVLIYTVLIFLLPINQDTMQAYHLSSIDYRIITFIIALPAMLSWFAAFVGYVELHQYAHYIRKTTEGEHFNRLATGCAWLAWSLPLPVILALLLNAASGKWPSFHGPAVIISNYVNLLLPLIAFSIIGAASRGLVGDAKLKFSLASARVIIILFLSAGVLYCYLTFRHFNSTSLASTDNPYFLPLWLMVLTVTIPYLYAWFVGLLAAYEITLFSKHLDGVLYRQALRLLVGGLIAVIISSIALQYINSVQPRVGNLMVDYRLALSTLFRIIGGIGFVLLAMGALRLKKIEEV